MRKVILWTMVLMLGVAFSANAALYQYNNIEGDNWVEAYLGYTGDDFSGYYLGTIGGNISDAGSMDGYLATYLDDIGFSDPYEFDFFKVEDGAGTDGALTVSMYGEGDTGYESGWDSGQWWLADSYGLGFYAVKGGPEFALYYVDPLQTSGTWTSRHLLNPGGQIPAISHFTARTTGATPTPKPVPEPAIMMLMGAGLAGIVVIGRRRRGGDK